MQTEILKVREPLNKDTGLKKAVDIIKKGGLVVFPTETVFGLGANALNELACLNIYKAKNRPFDNPLIIHLANKKDIYQYAVDIPHYAEILMSNLCPGPITFLFRKTNTVPNWITANQETVCIRIPNHPVALELIQQCGVPIAAPSANTSTRPSATTALDAYTDLNGKVDLILDTDLKPLGIESTIIDCTTDAPQVLRAGATTLEEISNLTSLSIESLKRVDTKKHITPGSKYKHYAPSIELVALKPNTHNSEIFQLEIENARKPEKEIRLLSTTKTDFLFQNEQIIYKSDELYMQNLFYEFRKAEKDMIDILFVEMLTEEKLGLGVNDRIKKAAVKII